MQKRPLEDNGKQTWPKHNKAKDIRKTKRDTLRQAANIHRLTPDKFE